MPSHTKNILFCSTFGNLRWGGQKSLYHLVTRLDRTKYRPVVLLPTEEDLAEMLRGQKMEVVIHELPPIGLIAPFACLLSVRYLFRLIETHDIALMHTDGPRNTLYAGLVSWLKAIPVVFHVRASDRDRYDRIIYRCSDRIVLVAEALRDRFDWVNDNSKFRTIYNGVDLKQFEGPTPASIAVEVQALSGKEVMIVCAGRVEPQKGQYNLIEACAKLKDARIPFQLLLAGDVTDEKYLATCRNKAMELKINDRITFSGHIENMPDVLYRTDIFVLPSIHGEAFSRAIIEAMAAGRPVVATDVGGAREAIEEGVSGFIVPPANPATLAEKILLLARDASVRRKFGAAARKRVEERFTIERNVRKTEQVYAELLRTVVS
ncbi:MAG: glycosyltransferase family 4 protein [Deltaproteobacteria bacterium]|nr:glycosyltransferase family 4 protein [Deltaproteobacteria bacterium]